MLLRMLALSASSSPIIDPVPNANVPAGKTLILPVTGSTTNDWPLRYSATSSHPDINVHVHTNNPHLRLSVANFGDMTFQLLRDVAPETVQHIAGFAQGGFYNGLTFHRVIEGFMIQGGDPSGTGGGGPGFRFIDEFHPDVVFNGKGQLAMANSGKDSNGSQFFITVGPQRALDFNHTIFGQLIRGFDVLTNINSVATGTNDRPVTPVVISQACVVPNTTDAVVTLKAVPGSAAVATITLTVDDGHGGTAVQTFQAQAAADAKDDPPILGPVENMVTPVNTPITWTLTATDLENHPLIYAAQLQNNPPLGTLLVTNNQVTVTPNPGFTGPISLVVGVRQEGATSRGSTLNPFDVQGLTLAVGGQQIEARAASFTAAKEVPFTNLTLATFDYPDPNMQTTNFTAAVSWGDGQVTNANVVARTNGGFEVQGGHMYAQEGTFPTMVQIAHTLGSLTNVHGNVHVPPTLEITRADNGVAIEWPAWTIDYVLESKSDLGAATGWTPVERRPELTDCRNRLREPLSVNGTFFRLRRAD